MLPRSNQVVIGNENPILRGNRQAVNHRGSRIPCWSEFQNGRVPLSGLSGSAKSDGILCPLNLTSRTGSVGSAVIFWTACEGPGYDRNLTQPKTILSAIDYVHENPVRRKLCQRAVDWHWSSARSYLSGGTA